MSISCAYGIAIADGTIEGRIVAIADDVLREDAVQRFAQRNGFGSGRAGNRADAGDYCFAGLLVGEHRLELSGIFAGVKSSQIEKKEKDYHRGRGEEAQRTRRHSEPQ